MKNIIPPANVEKGLVGMRTDHSGPPHWAWPKTTEDDARLDLRPIDALNNQSVLANMHVVLATNYISKHTNEPDRLYNSNTNKPPYD